MYKWIDVTVRLPKAGNRVLTIALDCLQHEDSVSSELAIYDPFPDPDEPWANEEGERLDFVSHWKPL
jgi:hypothetical protein